jgi:putative transposase
MVSDTHHRRSVRLQGYDYAQAGAYFVTICTQDRECSLGKVVDGEMALSDAGRMVQSVWEGLPGRFPTVELDQFVVMPNHIHGILVLVGAQFIAPTVHAQNKRMVGAQFIAPNASGRDKLSRPTGRDKSRPYIGTAEPGMISRAPTLGEVVRAFKAATARQIRFSGLQNLVGNVTTTSMSSVMKSP